MKSITKYTDTLFSGNKVFVNFNKFITIPDEIFNSTRYFYYITVSNDTRLDIISFKEYGSNIYADLIFYVNKMTSVFDLPKNDSYVKNIIDTHYQEYIDKEIVNKKLLEAIHKNITEKFTRENELHRNLRMVKPDYINEVIGIIKNGNRI